MTHGWLRSLGAFFLRRQVGQNLASVQGLDNVPPSGGFVLVCNHLSYLDPFVVDFVLEAVRDRPTWYLTKRESFGGPIVGAWSRAWHGIPVDRQGPSPETVRSVRSKLGNGDAVCVYPEGTRNPEPTSLLRFKTGAFHFAETAGVPLIPAVIVGTDRVLPRGARRLRRGRIDVRFGPAVVVDRALPKPDRVHGSAQAARAWMEDALSQIRAVRARDDSELRGVGELADWTGRDPSPRARRRAAMFVAAARHRAAPLDAGPIIAVARMQGLKARRTRGPARWLLAQKAQRGLRLALRISPDDADVHYYLGVLRADGRRQRADAAEHLETAVRLTRERDPRPLIALAKCTASAGDDRRAHALLAAAEAALDHDDPRTPPRSARIAALRQKMASPS